MKSYNSSEWWRQKNDRLYGFQPKYGINSERIVIETRCPILILLTSVRATGDKTTRSTS